MKKYNAPITETVKVENGAFLMATGEGSVNMEGGVQVRSMSKAKIAGAAWY